MRQHATSWVVKILFGLLILSFSMWGIHDIFVGDADPAVATVAGTKIPVSQLDDAVKQEIERFQPMFGGSLDNAQAKQLGLIDQALERLIDRVVFNKAASDLGLAVGDQMVLRHIQSEPAFRDERGQFDRAHFQQVLMANNLTEDRYVALLRRDLATRQLAGVVGVDAPIPTVLVNSLNSYREESRVADAIAVPASQSSTPSPPDEATLADYYKSHTDRFMAPEYRTVSYVAVDPAALAGDIEVSDDSLRREYDSRLSEFTLRERRDVDQAVLRDEAEAKRVQDLLAQGRTLEAALKESGSKADVVKLGWVERADLIGEIAAPVFALKAGQVSAPLKSPLGWHIVRVNGAEDGRVQSLDEVRDQLRKDMSAREANDEAHDLSIKLEDALAGGASLSEAANQVGLTLYKVPPVDSHGLTEAGKAAPSLPPDAAFLTTAFATGEGEDSTTIELANGVFAVLEVNKIQPAAARPIEQIKTDLIASWQDEQRRAAAEKRAQALLDKIKGGQTPAAAAAAEKLTVQTTAPFTRVTHESDAGLPESLKADMFSMKAGEAAMGESREGYVVAVLKDVRPAPALAEDARNQLDDQLAQAIGSDLLDQFAGALRQRYKVDINHTVIDSRF
ncbi:MAG TPA: SurA N-terminal domain-containing protein [Alphaproteobacteria bacterium]